MKRTDVIGQWDFNYWIEKSKKSLLTISEDGTATTGVSEYLWRILNDSILEIYTEGYVSYKGELKNDIIIGSAYSECSGNAWNWYATKHIRPTITPILESEIKNGKWTIINYVDDLTDNLIVFSPNGILKSTLYPLGTWQVENGTLIIYTASNFITYKARCEDGIIKGEATNKIGDKWSFKIEHTIIEEIQVESHKTINTKKKDNKEKFIQVLEENGIHYFYHFTSEKNLLSIIKQKGLYSWKYLLDKNITIPSPGGDDLSRALDEYFGLEDYVRLSFCSDHPMKYKLRNTNPQILKVSIEVATFEDTLFSDINAASKKHRHGGTLKDLLRINFKAVKRTHVCREDNDYQAHQAEIMVKRHIPIEYIININDYKLK